MSDVLAAHQAGRHIAPHRDCPRCEDLGNRALHLGTVLDLASAAEYLGVTTASLRQAIARESLYATKVGTTWVVSLDSVATYERHRAARLVQEVA